MNFGLAIQNLEFNSATPLLYSPFTNILKNGNFVRPKTLSNSVSSLLKHDPLMKGLLPLKNTVMSLREFTSTIKRLDKLELLHCFMRVSPLSDLQFEELFTAMRSFIITNLKKIDTTPELINFLSTLCIHCFTNEYVYQESDEETQLVNELEAKIAQAILKSEQPEIIEIICFASYRPLHQYDWCQELEVLDHLAEVKTRLIEEPFAEQAIAKDIPILGNITDHVSYAVREQYEKNPYPRWVKLAIPLKARSIEKFCDDTELYLHSEEIKDTTAPALLVAGCGTGQHSIESASRFSHCHVTAVDLSLTSLAYAQRKTNELGHSNIEYIQADILELYNLDREFDIIESVGVLHHMDEPMAGWRTLVGLLKPGGLMRIGLYSELARQHIVKIRERDRIIKGWDI